MHHRRWLGVLTPILILCSLVLLPASTLCAQTTTFPWIDDDIGSPGAAGMSTEVSGNITVMGAGKGIKGSSDQFHYLHQDAEGDFDLRVYVGSLRGSSSMQAGLTVRASLAPRAPAVSLLYSPLTGISFAVRSGTGKKVTIPAQIGFTPPVYLRLVRSGSLVGAFYSTDGTAWTLLKRQTVSLRSDVLAGIAVASGSSSSRNTATFTGLSLTSALSQPPSQPKPPTVAVTSPAAGSAFDLPAAVSLAAAAADPDGTIARVDFFVGGVLVGSAGAAPYQVSWSAPAAGTYTLQAVATDNSGAATTSSAVAFTIRSVVPPPPTSGSAMNLEFTPSTDHNTLVTYYVFEVRPQGGSLTKDPISAMNLGLPAISGGLISVDITTLFANLAPGSYDAVVSAVGKGGKGTSAAYTFIK